MTTIDIDRFNCMIYFDAERAARQHYVPGTIDRDVDHRDMAGVALIAAAERLANVVLMDANVNPWAWEPGELVWPSTGTRTVVHEQSANEGWTDMVRAVTSLLWLASMHPSYARRQLNDDRDEALRDVDLGYASRAEVDELYPDVPPVVELVDRAAYAIAWLRWARAMVR